MAIKEKTNFSIAFGQSLELVLVEKSIGQEEFGRILSEGELTEALRGDLRIRDHNLRNPMLESRLPDIKKGAVIARETCDYIARTVGYEDAEDLLRDMECIVYHLHANSDERNSATHCFGKDIGKFSRNTMTHAKFVERIRDRGFASKWDFYDENWKKTKEDKPQKPDRLKFWQDVWEEIAPGSHKKTDLRALERQDKENLKVFFRNMQKAQKEKRMQPTKSTLELDVPRLGFRVPPIGSGGSRRR